MTVDMVRSRFTPPEVTVSVGTVLSFRNEDAFAHTVTARDDGDASAFDSGELGEGDEFEISFDDPGVHRYFCRIHPTMQGTVVVESAS